MACYALTFCTSTIVTALMWLLFRFEDAEIRQQVIGMLLLGMGFFGSVAFFSQRYSRLWVLPVNLIGLMLLPTILSLLPQFGLTMLVVIGVLGCVGLSIALLRERLHISTYIVAPVLGLLLGTYYFLGMQTASGQYAPLVGDLWIFTDSLHQDTVFHSAIASMLHSFNVPSTGLDGIPPLFYHVGIHRWVASCLHFLGGSSVTLLSCARDILWGSVFLFTLVSSLPSPKDLQLSWLIPIILCVGYEFISAKLDGRSDLLSESHLLSLPTFCAFIPIGLYWVRLGIDDLKNFSKVRLIPLAITTLAVFLCAIAKLSTGFILLTYLVVCLLVPPFLSNPKYWLKLIIPSSIVATLFLYLIKWAFLPQYPVRLFAFYFAFPSNAIFQLACFFVCMTLLWCSLQKDNKMRSAVCLTLATVFIVGQMPGLLFEIAGGGAWYFSNPTTWLCFIATMHFLLPYLLTRRLGYFYFYFSSTFAEKPEERITPEKFHVITFDNKLLTQVGLVIVLLLGVWTYTSDINNYATLFRNDILVETNKQMKKVLSLDGSPLALDIEEGLKGSAFDQISRLRQRFAEGKIALIKHTNLGRIKAVVDQMKTEKLDTIVYIPPASKDFNFWKEDEGFTNRSRHICWARPLAVPAVTGLPLINGVRSGVGDCPDIPYYGMSVYGKDARNQELSVEELCKRANKLGFSRVLEIKKDSHEFHSCK